MRLRFGFSPDAKRVRKRLFFRAAALRVASRSASGRITMPLPSTEITTRTSRVHGAGMRAW